ncbi:MAG TPA: 3-methyl-2-oxobutanoate hydroxymethyltransferase [Legionellales bacterium]|nr:3-methyl-2-oxobutanoate hydroxymethyltransferase [Legionellales bacterium]
MSILRFAKKKTAGKKISMVTCYDYPSAKMVANSDIDVVLVGDSVAMVVHGFDSTLMASMDMMVMHTQAVARGIQSQFIVADMPFMAHRGSMETTCDNAKRLIQAGAHAVKIEGADEHTLKVMQHLVSSCIPVMGHIGLQPQAVLNLGGYKVQGRNESDAQRLVNEAKALQEAGCFALVLECIPEQLAQTITDNIAIASIGIGAGRYTDGQVLVWHDLLGLQKQLLPKFVKQFDVLEPYIVTALNQYHQEVEQGLFPEAHHVYEQ